MTIKSKKTRVIRPLSLRKNFSWTFLGNVIYAICQWGILVALAKLGTPELVGRFSLALAITGPIFMFTNLQLRGVQATDTKGLYSFGDYLGLRIITSISAFVITVLFIFVVNYPIETGLVIIIMCLAKLIESLSDVVFGLLQKKELMNWIAVSMILKGVLSLLVTGITIWLSKSLILATILLSISWLFVFLLYDKNKAVYLEKFKPKYNFSTLINLTKLSLPLGLVLMMGSLNTNIPRYFLEFYMSEEVLGYFSAMAYLLVAGNTVMNALGQSASPKLAKYYSKGNLKGFRNLLGKMMFIGFMLGTIGLSISMIFGEEVLTVIYQKEYGEYSDILVLIMLAGLINYTGSFLGYGMTAARFFKVQPIIGTVWVLTTLIGSYILIPVYGIRGAAFVLILSSIVQLLTKLAALFYLIIKNNSVISNK